MKAKLVTPTIAIAALTILFYGGRESSHAQAALKAKTTPGSPSRASDTRDIDIHKSAQKNKDNLSSRDAPGTLSGSYACAWAVNHVVKDAIGRDVSGDVPDGLLSTAVMYDTLVDQRGEEVDLEKAPAGSIVISPTRWVGGSRNTGHVGILGQGTGNQRLIYSNSSRPALWKQNFTVGEWNKRYRTEKGLEVKIFRFAP